MIVPYRPPKRLDNLLPPEDTTDLDATTSAHGLLPKLDGDSDHYLDGDGNWTSPIVDAVMDSDFDANTLLKADSDDTPTTVTVPEDTLLGRKLGGTIAPQYPSDVRNMINVADGADVTADQKLDDLSAPDDNTDLNATTSAHGLMPKLDGTPTHIFSGDGSWVEEKDYQPQNLLIYYGWLNTFNSATLGWNNELVAQALSQYDILVFGSDIQDPGHADYANTQVVLPRIRALHPDILIFGNVTLNQSQANFETKATQWDVFDIDGIFIDAAGYDSGKTRSEFNTAVDYVHALTHAQLAFANAWNIDHVIGTVNDPAYPNTTYNPTLLESHLTDTDWCLFASCPISDSAYGGNDYQPFANWKARLDKGISRRATYGINLASVSIIDDANAGGQAQYDFHFVAALIYSLDAQGSSHLLYGAVAPQNHRWDRPDVSNMGSVWTVSPNVMAQVGAADKFMRYMEFGELYLNYNTFTTTISKYMERCCAEVKRTAVGAGNYNPSVLTTDCIIAVDNTAAARSVVISTEDVASGTASVPRIMHIVDESGGAGANNITISLENGGTISGAANVVISGNHDTVSIYLTGTNGFIY